MNNFLSWIAAFAFARTLLRCAWAVTMMQAFQVAYAWAEEPDYQLGSGVNVGNFNIAGYANLIADAPQGERKSLSLDDLSLFVSGHMNKVVNPFIEVELTGLPLLHGSGVAPSDETPYVVLERLYNDTYLSNEFTLRIGKMLAPVGEWNQIHAAPLVSTTTRPLVTERGFSGYVSGTSLIFVDPTDKWPEIQAYWQPAEDLAARPSSLTAHRYCDVEGLHLNWPIDLTDKIGFSFQRSRVVGSNEEQFLYGANAKFSFDRFTIDSETTLSSLSGGSRPLYRRTEWGAYVLGSYAISDRWSVFSWYEQFTDRRSAVSARDVLTGVAFSPVPSLVFKAERVTNFGADWGNPTGYFASLAVLF